MIVFLFLSQWLMIPQDNTNKQAYDLTPQYHQGHLLYYDESMEFRLSSAAIEGGGFGYTVRNVVSEKVKHVRDDGSVILEVVVEKSETEGVEHMKAFYNIQPIVGLPITLELDPKMRVKKVNAPENLPKEGVQAFEQIKEQYLNFGQILTPDKLISVGESWKDRKFVSTDTPVGPLDQVFDIQGEFRKLNTWRDVPGFEIGFNCNISGNVSEGAGGTTQGSLTGNYSVDQEKKQLLTMDSEMEMRSVRITPQGEASWTVNVRYHRERRDTQAVIR